MKKNQIEKIIKSTVHLAMLNPTTKLPDGIGSGCVVSYQGRELLLTVAHVTNVNLATCIDRGLPEVGGQTPLYSVGGMYYLQKFDMSKYEQQIQILEKIEEQKLKNENHVRKEEIDFGFIDFSFAILKDKADFIQRRLEFKDFTIAQSKKLTVRTNLDSEPSSSKEYGFFGRIKPCLIKGPIVGFETSEVFYGGLKFVRKVGHYYEFELPNVVSDHTDFKGTSGAPIMDSDGEVVALVTHGYEGAKFVYGTALADFKSGVDGMILTDEFEGSAKK